MLTAALIVGFFMLAAAIAVSIVEEIHEWLTETEYQEEMFYEEFDQ